MEWAEGRYLGVEEAEEGELVDELVVAGGELVEVVLERGGPSAGVHLI